MKVIPSQEAIRYALSKILVTRTEEINKLGSHLESYMAGWNDGAAFVFVAQKEVLLKVSEGFIIQHRDKLIGTVEYWHECEHNLFMKNVELATRYYSRELAETTANVIRQHHNGLALEIVHVQTTTSQIEATELPR
jgi:hypothetical protein